MTTKKAIDHLVKQLERDSSYRDAWLCNIAMAFMDNWTWYAKKTGKRVMSRTDRHTIANNAADYFLKQLCHSRKPSSPV